ncbi:MAG: hypothetical protein WAX45_05990 [Trichococcus flocculiformis]
MKKITLIILGLLLMYGCAGASEPVANPAEEAMNALAISASDYTLSSSSQSFFAITIENSSDQDFVNANFYLSIHNEGDAVTVNFEIPSGFLVENDVKAFEEMDRLIAFVQADGYIENTEKDNYYSFGESVEYKTY